MVNVFAVPVFFICLRETIETGIIVAILLAFLKRMLGPDRDAVIYKRLVRQVWLGTIIGLIVCIAIGAGLIGAFYGLGKNHWEGAENIWEGAFSLIASIIITLMGAALLRVSKLQDKWRVKIAKALESKDVSNGRARGGFKRWCEKYALFMLPFITVLREGLEGVVFIGGVSLGLPASSFPLPVVVGIACGCLVGFLIYKGGNFASIQTFLIVSTCFLYLVAAGLFSKGVWRFEVHKWGTLAGTGALESGSGPGSYDIRQSVWHVNCCNPNMNGGGGWGIFNALFGWTNSATYGSVISYNLYWLCVIVAFLAMRYNERKGHWPLLKRKTSVVSDSESTGGEESTHGGVISGREKTDGDEAGVKTTVKSVGS
ncbi:hypothetical protein MMC16_006340 [Acarospora aff. strigata]|nr:hypothetical protein [Acarospora aff. strigata]